MGALLASGCLDGNVVTCPWHAWRFRVTDGTWCDNPRIKTDVFEVRVVGDEIQVRDEVVWSAAIVAVSIGFPWPSVILSEELTNQKRRRVAALQGYSYLNPLARLDHDRARPLSRP